MSIKVVRGIVGESKTTDPTNQLHQVQNQGITTSQANLIAASKATILANEAVNVNLRTQRTASTGERIKDSKEAREVADKVAEQVRTDEKAVDAHDGLSTISSKAHFV